jgi:hypothetical protein
MRKAQHRLLRNRGIVRGRPPDLQRNCSGSEVELSYGSCKTPRHAAISLKFSRDLFLSDKRFNIFNSFPLPHLLGERALSAIGTVPHTKVLVDLKQTLLVRDSFQELFPA